MNGSSPPSKEPPYLKFAKYLAGIDTKKPISAKQESEIWSCMTNAVIGVIMLVLASALIYVASTDQAAASNRMYVYSVLIIVPVLVAAYMMVPTFGSKPSGPKLTAYGIFLCVLFVIAYFLMRNMSMKEIVYANYLIMFLGICVGIFLAVLMYKISIRYLMSLEGWSGFIAKLVLYIPCLIRDIIVETTNIYAKLGMILLFVGLISATVYYMVFRASDGFYNTDIHPLNTVITKDITGSDAGDLMHLSGLNSDTRAKNYTIGAWVYLPAQTTWSRILSLRKASDSDSKEKGTPSVMYSSEKLRITLSNSDTNPIIKEVPIMSQRWNHLVFVYEDNVANLYLNSELKFSEPLTDALPTYSFSDELVTGDDTQIVGNIGGIAYIAKPYSAQQIATIYNATRGFYV